MDTISMERFRVACYVGVSDRERRKRQLIPVTIRLHLSLVRAGRTDGLGDTVDYAALSKRIARESGKRHYHLLESLAGHVASICLAQKRVRAVDVRVEKRGVTPSPVAVEIHRSQRGRSAGCRKNTSTSRKIRKGAGK